MTALRTRIKQPILLPMVVVGLFLGPLLAGVQPVLGDPELMYRPIKRELALGLREGRLPFWSDRFGLGVPLVAESHAAAFYPPNWLLYGTLDTSAAFRLSGWLHYVALAAASDAYARVLKLSPPASTLVAIGFSLCGFQAVHAAHEPFYTLMPYLPLCLLLAEKWLETGRLIWPTLLALAWGCQLTVGHFQIQMWTAGLVLAIGGWRVIAGSVPRRRWGALCGALAVGAAIAFVQLRLTWELTRATNFFRPAQFLSNYRFPITHWAQWALPSLYLGRPMRPDDLYWASLSTTSDEACAYVGITALILACIGLVNVGRRTALGAWCVVSALAFALSTMATWWPTGFELLLSLPGIGWFRAPARYTLLPSLGLILLAGHGLDSVARGKRFGWGLALAVAVGLAAAAGGWRATADAPLYRSSLEEATFPLRIGAAVAGWALGLAVVCAWRRRLVGSWAPLAVLTVELCALFYVGPILWAAPPEIVRQSPVLRRLAEEPGVGLVAGKLQNLPTLIGAAAAYPDLGITAPPPNYLLEACIRPPGQLTPEDWTWLRRFGVSHGVWAAGDDVRGADVIAELDDPALRRVFWEQASDRKPSRWVLVRNPEPLPAAWVATRGREVWSWEILFATLSNENGESEAWFVHGDHSPQTEASARLTMADFQRDRSTPRPVEISLGTPATRAEVRSWDGDEALVEHDGACFAIFRRTHYRGWSYRVNGGPSQPVLKANGGLQCVPLLGSGPSRITFEYHPTGLRRAATISLASTGLALLAAASCLIRDLARNRR
ncbi:MAG: hypothetical protein U0790_10795 [Isosphaeraceae bacterium]